MSDEEVAGLLIAAGVILVILVILQLVARKVRVATNPITIPVPAGQQGVARVIPVGAAVPADIGYDASNQVYVRRSLLLGIVVGKDNRTSSSKTVAFAWTLVIVWGLLALIFALWAGDGTGWDEQLKDGVQADYLLLLGGPYAAAVIAKMRAVSDTTGRTPAAPGTASVQQLVTDDEDDTNLSDFQYILFNLVAIVYFVGEFISDMDYGFPDLPSLLSGLIFTSITGYTATKLIAEAKPTLTSVLPVSARAGTAGVKVYGQNLVIPALVPKTGTAQPPLMPSVSIGGQPATVTAHETIVGSDVLTVDVDAAAKAGAGAVTVVRADGVPATGPGGAGGIAFTVEPPPGDDSSK